MLPRLVALGPRLLALGLATVALELVIAVPGLATEQRLSRRPFARSILPDLIELPPDRILPAPSDKQFERRRDRAVEPRHFSTMIAAA